MATASYYSTTHRSAWTVTEGIVLVIVGFFALGAPLVAATAMSLVLPLVLAVEGVVLIVSAFMGRTFGSALWHILLGAVALIGAAAVFARPIIAIASLPIILGAYLLLKGFVEIGIAASANVSGRGLVWFSALVNIALGLLLFTQPFGASLVLTGIYIGVSILMTGILLLMAPAAPAEQAM